MADATAAAAASVAQVAQPAAAAAVMASEATTGQKRPSDAVAEPDADAAALESAKRRALSGTEVAAAGPAVAAGAVAAAPVAAVGGGEEVTLRFLIPTAFIGAVIGKQGAIIKQIRETSGAQVRVADQTGPRDPNGARITTTVGTPQQVANAVLALCTCLQGAKGPEAGDSMDLDLCVAHEQVGAIIGSGGASVKLIRESSGANVGIDKAMLPGSNERKVTLSGSSAAISSAVLQLSVILAKTPLKGSVQFYNPGAQAPAAFGGMPAGYGAQPGFPPRPGMPAQPGFPAQQGYAPPAAGFPPAGPSQQTQISIANEHVGQIIGRGGATINQIRQMSQANIRIGDRQPSMPSRVVTIVGNEQQRQTALHLIQQSLNAIAGV